ncbi:MAG TPA: M3 family oligoendopeptidase [Alphaproteobacteria bacterium]|nr:M3 family oligoendopeptidase [Alphaproteobacteria bacterium]HQS93995.1 M3 family oligoendopeptidase [Alphaproteobacteria bacterium]
MTSRLPRWKLSDLYKGMEDQSLEKEFEEAEASIHAFKTTYQGKIASLSPETFLKSIVLFENIQEKLGKIQAYAYLLFSTHNQDEAVIGFFQGIEERVTVLSTDLLFFTLEINRLEDKDLQNKFRNFETPYLPWIAALRLFKGHELSDDLEQVFHELSIPASQAWVRLFDETLGSLNIPFEGKDLNLSDALNLFSSPDRETRKDIATCLSRVLEENGSLLALVYNTLMKEKGIEDKWRHYPNPQMSRHLSNQIEEEVVEALSTAVTNAYPTLSHRYYTLKAQVLGLKELQYWDRNAPLFQGGTEITYTWEEAQSLVLEAYRDFSPEMADIGKTFFEEGWIDADLYPGKDSGAYSHPTVPSAHPYILMNFYGKGRDVMTLAHELGHGVHQVLASSQGYFLSDTPLTVAETASVFGEMLTFQKMLKGLKDPLQKKYLLSQKIEDMLNTVVRQIAFYTFEKQVHEKRKYKELSLSDFGEIWMKTQRDALGPIFNFDESYRIYWTYISHFIHSPFYVYAYAVGDCLVNSLYRVYEEAPIGFCEKYLDLLKAGGSKPYGDLLKPFNLNPKDPTFWTLGLSYIETLIDEFEVLVNGE